MSLEKQNVISVGQYLRKISGLEKETLVVDHNYVKSWDAHPDSNRTKPAKLLFMKNLHRYPIMPAFSNRDEDVDIEGIVEPIASPFDNPRTHLMAAECERSLKYTSLFGVEEEEKEIELHRFSPKEQKLYKQVMDVIDSERLARLTFSGSVNEPLKRRISVDKAASSLNQIFGLTFWNMELLGWLHRTILSNSDLSTLSIYADLLQTLKAKMPLLIDELLQVCAGSVVGDAVIQVVKKPWDPVLPILNQNKPKKLPGSPIILLCPSGPNHQAVSTLSSRFKAWQNNLSSLCKVINVTLHEDVEKTDSLENCLQQIMDAIRQKVAEIKNHYPNRPLILLGWTIGALIACHIALQDPIDGVICLGFPLTGVNGSRGDLSDPLLDNRVPTLFIVGQSASMCFSDDIEDFRSRMRAETGLVVLGGADDMLKMCSTKMMYEGVTQPIVDRCLIDEIADFLMQVVIKVPSSSTAVSVSKVCTPIKEEEPTEKEKEGDLKVPEEDGKRRRRKPREYSPELSPVRKRPRHHVVRQVSSAKARLSPSSSESSSSGTLAQEKPPPTRTVKKTSEKKVGRPSAGTWRKRTPTKNIGSLSVAEQQSMNIAKMLSEKYEEDSTKLSETKPALPFSKNILPKRNEPVDVDKAFGKDSSFLPRPLTPPEPEDTVSAEETERAMAELEAGGEDKSDTSESAVERSFQPISELAKEKISEQPSDSLPLDTAKPLTLTQNLQSVLAQEKAESSTLTAKPSGISLLTSNSGCSSKSTIITVPSATAASYLVSNPAMRTQSGKMIQFLSTKKNSHFTLKGGKIVSSSDKTHPFSLLYDKESSRRSESSSSATLVKLAPERGPFQGVKCLKVIKTVRSSPPPIRVETAEELVEKQLAIQALNKSIGIESHSSLVKESGYSICYAKADGSIVSRSVARPQSSFVPSLAGRGRSSRGRPPFTSKFSG